jgi:hypothetical protein
MPKTPAPSAPPKLSRAAEEVLRDNNTAVERSYGSNSVVGYPLKVDYAKALRDPRTMRPPKQGDIELPKERRKK